MTQEQSLTNTHTRKTDTQRTARKPLCPTHRRPRPIQAYCKNQLPPSGPFPQEKQSLASSGSCPTGRRDFKCLHQTQRDVAGGTEDGYDRVGQKGLVSWAAGCWSGPSALREAFRCIFIGSKHAQAANSERDSRDISKPSRDAVISPPRTFDFLRFYFLLLCLFSPGPRAETSRLSSHMKRRGEEGRMRKSVPISASPRAVV